MKLRRVVNLYVVLSAVATLLLLLVFTLKDATDVETRSRQIITGLFMASCLFGISLAFKPNWRWLFMKKATARKGRPGIDLPPKKGHHPACGRFRRHVISTVSKVHCAGCLGLAVGAVIAIFLAVTYYIQPGFIPWNRMVPLMGLLLIAMTMAGTLSRIGTHGRLILNVIFVPGFFFIVVGVLELTGSLIFAFLTLVFCFLWLDTRIQLSRWAHHGICRRCSRTCKTY